MSIAIRNASSNSSEVKHLKSSKYSPDFRFFPLTIWALFRRNKWHVFRCLFLKRKSLCERIYMFVCSASATSPQFWRASWFETRARTRARHSRRETPEVGANSRLARVLSTLRQHFPSRLVFLWTMLYSSYLIFSDLCLTGNWMSVRLSIWEGDIANESRQKYERVVLRFLIPIVLH